MRAKARTEDVANALSCLSYVCHYYPSGTKQVEGSRLDQLVEQVRDAVVQDMLFEIRQRAPEDLGDNLDDWFSAYLDQNGSPKIKANSD